MQDSDITIQRRSLIDLVAETRSRSVRVALFGALLHRSDPDNLETEDEQSANLRVLIDTARWIERVHKIVSSGRDPWDEIPPELSSWVQEHSNGDPIILEKLQGISNLSNRVVAAAEEEKHKLGRALRDHYEFRRNGFMEAVTAFCDRMWDTMDCERSAAVSQATNAGKTIKSTLERLEHIGKHVQLVSLNASVEAARIGSEGQGIGIIAREFKTLSEEIQTLSISASQEIAKLTSQM